MAGMVDIGCLCYAVVIINLDQSITEEEILHTTLYRI